MEINVLNRLMDAMLATLVDGRVVAAAADLAHIDSMAVSQPRVLHLCTQRPVPETLDTSKWRHRRYDHAALHVPQILMTLDADEAWRLLTLADLDHEVPEDWVRYAVARCQHVLFEASTLTGKAC